VSYRLGIDVGGTFTDLYLLNESNYQVETLKVASSPDDPSRAIVGGVTTLLERHSIRPEEVAYLSHGTTVATNTILQQVGAKVGLVTTSGFRDLLEIGRQKRPSVYDLFADKPPVLVPRYLRQEVIERVGHDGSVLLTLDAQSLESAVKAVLDEGIEALAVCFLHAYANPEHERQAKALAKKRGPSLYVCASHELTAEFREYERFLTTVLNAYVGPILSGYLLHLRENLHQLGLRIDPYIIQSNGGLMSVTSAVLNPIRTALSGPSAGVVGAAYVATLAGSPNIITLDMGGTSTDVSLLRDTKPRIQSAQQMAGYPVRVPTVAIHTIGAGGGSIAWIDDALGFHVGPRSAGAVPGPAVYGLGGDRPTVTDANVVLGRLNQEALLGGAMPIRKELAADSIRTLADRLNMTLEQAAAGVIRIVVSNMVRAVRVISVEKGEDPRDFALMAFGGAGPLHATAVAKQLGIRQVIVPPAPGLLCALGALLAVPRMEYSKTRVFPVTEDYGGLAEVFQGLAGQARAWLKQESVPREAWRLEYSVDMRYVGQNHELTLPLPEGRIDRETVLGTVEGFHQEHNKQFGYSSPGNPVQIVTCRVVARGVETQLHPTWRPVEEGPIAAPRALRPVYFESTGEWVQCPVYLRDDLVPGAVVKGPAIIEQTDSTTVLYHDDSTTMDGYGTLIVDVGLP
jgi:N-methylhydantoinase A